MPTNYPLSNICLMDLTERAGSGKKIIALMSEIQKLSIQMAETEPFQIQYLKNQKLWHCICRLGSSEPEQFRTREGILQKRKRKQDTWGQWIGSQHNTSAEDLQRRNGRSNHTFLLLYSSEASSLYRAQQVLAPQAFLRRRELGDEDFQVEVSDVNMLWIPGDIPFSEKISTLLPVAT